MIDLHCHILPGIDDGARTLEDSLAILKMEYEQGIRKIVFTPHFYPERISLEEFLQNRQNAYNELIGYIHKNDLFPEMHFKLGAEVFFSPTLMDMDLRKLCFEESEYLLIEFPTSHKPYKLEEVLYAVLDLGLIPIIAHIERYNFLIKDPTLIYNWILDGCVMQMNAGTLIETSNTLLYRFIPWNLVQILSSDAHSTGKRCPRLKEGMKKIEEKYGKEYVEHLKQNATDIFEGEYLEINDIHCPKKFLGKWR